MRTEDQNAIEDLFERLRKLDRNSGARDPLAEQLIRQRLAEQPEAAYYMAQTIIVQEAALRDLQGKLEAAETRDSSRRTPTFDPTRERRGPWDRGPDRDERPGFLAGAAQTALGVTGGLLLGSAIASLFTGGAQAAEPPQDDLPEDDGSTEGDFGSDFDIGGDF